MTGYAFFHALRVVILLGLTVVVAVGGLAAFIVNELMKEARYREKFGEVWQVAFERDFGSLTRAHIRIGISALAIVAICCLSVWLYRIVTADGPSGHVSGRRRHKRHWFGGSEHYRRNALIAIVAGVVGIFGGVFLSLFQVGIFEQHDNETALGVFVFICGYCCVIAGCRWWLKAKEWNDAVVFIGLLPLVILFIPFVRLIFLASPLLLPASMVMMPLILIVVVAVLPDKAASGRRPWWDRE